MGNAESSPAPSMQEDDRSSDASTPVNSTKASPPMALQRKGSSFLEEPIIHKMTERGEAQITIGCELGENEREGCEVDTNKNMLRYAVSEMQGWRSHMEDKHCLNPKLYLNKQQKLLLKDHHLFAVFDGHGGDYASHFCGENFVSTLHSQKEWQSYLKLSSEGSTKSSTKRESVIGLTLLKSALTGTFLDLDVKLLEAQRKRRLSQLSQLESVMYNIGGDTEFDVFQPGTADHARLINFSKSPLPSMPAVIPLERSGSTGVVVLITPSHILCANAGDSRALLSKKSKKKGSSSSGSSSNTNNNESEVLPLSFDHKPNNDAEVTRVENDGGFVRAGRVDGDLAVSRSFGDFGYKKCERVINEPVQKLKKNKVTVHPDILVHTREPTRDEFVVLACDGIWDRLTNRDCADLVRNLVRKENESDVGLICEEVIDTALELDSRDNMTCCTIFFPAADLDESNTTSPTRLNLDGGVMKRRISRERQWGDDSTPAKRAQDRLNERRNKNREMIAMQNSKRIKSQARRQRSATKEKVSAAGSSSGPSSSAAGIKKHRGSSSNMQPPKTLRTSSRTRSSKSSRIHVNPEDVARQ